MIDTKNFVVNELQPIDAANLFDLMSTNSERFRRYFPKTLGQNLSESDSKDFIKRKQKENADRSEFTWGIRDASNNNVVGLLILKELHWNKGVGEFAYCIEEAYEGRGWITQIVRESSRYAFEILKLKRLQIIAHLTNEGSVRVAEKCGFKWQKVLKASHTPPGESPMDMELYELYYEG